MTTSQAFPLDLGLKGPSTHLELSARLPRLGSLRPPPDPACVLIVIPTLNEEARIRNVLTSLLAHPPRAAETRVVVVDGGSRDRTATIVAELAHEHPQLHLLHNPARLQSAGMNLAARTFGRGADVLVRCDAHAAYPAGFCQRLLDALKTHGADSVVVPLVSGGEAPLQRAVAWISNTALGTGGSAHRAGRRSGFVDHGHHAAFRMESFRRSGGYDESFSHNEDAELDCRQRALGARLFLDAETRIDYHPRSSLAALARQYFKYGEGRSRTIRRHPSSVRLRQLAVPAHVMLLGLAFVLGHEHPLWLAWPALYASILLVASLYFALRKRSLAGLLCGPAAAVMHVAWGGGFVVGLLSRAQSGWAAHHTEPLWDEPLADSSPRLRSLLVDPSLFTAPYDAALTEGLLAAGVRPSWAVRPVRTGDRQEIAEPFVDEIFYKKSDQQRALPGKLRVVAKGLAHVVGLTELVRRVYATRPDVVHFQWLVVPLLDAVAIAVIRRRVPVVVTVHDTVAFNGDKRLQAWGADLPLKMADKLIVHTRAGHATLRERGFDADRLAVIPHGPLALSATVDDSTAKKDPRWTFVLFGEIKRYKGLDILIEALGLMTPELRAKARVIVAGRPLMDLEPVLARIAELGLEPTIELRAHRHSEQEMAELFHAADCFVFPYRQIDASGVYFLVKSLPKWLIASSVGIFEEDLQDGVRGTLVPPEDPRALAGAMTLALSLRYRPSGLTTDEDWASIGAQTRNVYSESVAAREQRA